MSLVDLKNEKKDILCSPFIESFSFFFEFDKISSHTLTQHLGDITLHFGWLNEKFQLTWPVPAGYHINLSVILTFFIKTFSHLAINNGPSHPLEKCSFILVFIYLFLILFFLIIRGNIPDECYWKLLWSWLGWGRFTNE